MPCTGGPIDGGRHGRASPALCGSGCAQGQRGGGRAPCRGRRGPHRGPPFRHHHARAAGPVGVAGRGALQPRRHGGHRRVLEAGLARAVGRRVRAGAGQCHARQERARPQDRRRRRGLAGRSAGPRPDPGQLRARGADPGTAGPAAHPQATRARTGQPRAADPEGAGGRQPQARLGAHRRHGGQRPRHPGRHRQRRARSRHAARPGAPGRQGEFRQAAGRSDGTRHRAPPLPVAPASGPSRRPGVRRARHRRRGGARPRPFPRRGPPAPNHPGRG
ncbi:hypothetical protein FH972_027297 [Carpinus fangiana]|uniref:Uncharacterized protein n=1 Tax=Carpinus fangiana TaxID=176857 RepID=A0A5N6LXQ0_9ROSI|nr:hypothetical protein FH972_027297 [Carpinus fangiana]